MPSPRRDVRSRPPALTLWILGLALLGGLFSPVEASASGVDFRLVAEMEAPAGILYQLPRERTAWRQPAVAEEGLAALRSLVADLWPQIRKVDLEALSRFQLEAMQGFELPPEPGELTGEAIGWDAASGRYSLELRGPRLPARFEIVYRYLTFYATYDPVSGELAQLSVTIRGWVLE